MSCIPGSIGGGIRMNSGCFNNEFKDVVISLQTIDYNGQIKTILANKLILNIELIYQKILFFKCNI